MVVKLKQGSRAAVLLRRGASCVLAASLCLIGTGTWSLSAWADGGEDQPAAGGDVEAQAAKTVNIGTGAITAPEGGWDAESGNYFYFGSYEGTPVKYRVLSNDDGKLLLDSDKVLACRAFNANSSAQDTGLERAKYSSSDIAAYLSQGKIACEKTSKDDPQRYEELFGDVESDQIAGTTLENITTAYKAGTIYNTDVTWMDYCDESAQSKAFLLSAAQADGLYASDTARAKTGVDGTEKKWWLRSTLDPNMLADETRCYPGGLWADGSFYFFEPYAYSTVGIAPASYLQPKDSYLFTVANGFDKTQALSKVETTDSHEWKATLQTGGSFQLGDGAADENGLVTMSYTYRADESSKLESPQISVALVSGDMEDGGEVLYYGKVADSVSAEGTFSFQLPEGLPEGYKAYAFAEQVGASGCTDYATAPADFSWEEPAPAASWQRLAGNTALGTMKAVAGEWESSEWAVVATDKSYYDALSASGLAGMLGCPVLLTDPASLSKAAADVIASKGVAKVVVAGGPEAVSDAAFNQIVALDGVQSVERVAGATAIGTANAIYEYGKGVGDGWGKDAVVATAKGYHDAASIASYAYAKHAPIFLASAADGDLGAAGAAKIAAGGFTRTIIVGGEAAVAGSVEAKVVNPTRLGGGTAYGTCKKVAQFCLGEGMTVEHMGVATGRSYQDAIAGAALCGKMNSVLILADDGNSSNVDAIVAKNKESLGDPCYIFGGPQAVSLAVEKKILAASE